MNPSPGVTRTGSFPIGFRRGWSDWQKKSIRELAQWARSSGFALLDLMNVSIEDLKTVRDAGLDVGSIDLLDFGRIMADDSGARKELIARNIEYIQRLAPAGAKVFFTCIIPADPTRPRAQNYDLAVECFAPIAHACAEHGAWLVVEGWPGGAPYLANLGCTPETVRAFLKDVGRGAGINYDPSHLIRLGVDHIRFLREFAPHVKHVHAKDTDLDADALYEYGTQGAAFAKPHGFGEWTWRYTIPGHGVARWGEIFRILQSAGYKGGVCVELEDENFNGSEAGEKAALLHSLDFLRGV
ncbi:sugar phosphate isomerase/epimerase family protein [Fontivita pretiosa]|uniref:sugar phosphate isomerase/epimerase family protein n=1 Tax=Fontivita pretiosa TaxID=2989684 RepID=UPI003D182F74